MKQQTFKPLILLHFSVFLFGAAGLFGKLLTISPVHITAGRLLFAFISLFLLSSAKKSHKFPDKKDSILFISGGLILALHWYSFFKSIQLASVSAGLIYFSSYPLFTNLIEWIIFKKKLRLRDYLSLFICVTGLFLTYFAKNSNNVSVNSLLFGVLSGFTFSILSFINRNLSGKYTVQTVSKYQFIIAFLCLLPSVLYLPIPYVSISTALYLIVLGVVFTALSHTLFIYALNHLPIGSVSLISCMEPVYGILLAFIILGEKLLFLQIVGAILIIGISVSESMIKKC